MENKNENVELINEEEIITLTADDGSQVDFYEVAVVDYNDELFAILEPADEMEEMEDGEVLIFKIEESDDNEEEDVFTVVEDEELLQAVFDEYLKAVSSYNSECDGECASCPSDCDDKE